MRKVLKWAGLTLGALLIVGIVAGVVAHQPLPKGKTGAEADQLARKMLLATGKEAWDSTRYVRWSFPGGHHYVWDKFREYVQVEWNGKKVLLHTPAQRGRAWEEGAELQGEAAAKRIRQAWAFFCNDSFWLNAPAKAFDPGTTRELIEAGDGKQSLLVRYSGGGVTPGDSYLWELDEQGLPVSWKMWVSVLPIGGLEASWEGWTTLETGARLATRHKIGFLTIEATGLSGGGSLQSVGLGQDPFLPLD
ncbi:MAG: hypothetical protein KDD19_06810 [Phaeodactylibacter sp.]|nr:hypothetical protein [Phaeodactylibacter sp.]MCB9051094.1 hypothetical protein [Lewinellaceae bacterium]